MTFKVKLAEDITGLGTKDLKLFQRMSKNLFSQLKRDKMHLMGTDPDGFAVYSN
jgi:hypothetical protein